ncbi:hypothetical protein K466DRAFT_480763 [Polyporus arcularius HHB13444]|uniref:Uncharacterized protein n=1 Tax=Polyporus arcularius HHB13444 TaxID=1314778 RepID=A0A5C3PSJ3_9APHY|nr:hypothetical protein K466DRAFT_480763 [Polyporus arcularius HHB13444]
MENREEDDVRYVLCHRREEPTPPDRQSNVPLLFDDIGEVSRDDFALTGYGIIGRPDEEVREAPMASGWLQERPNKMSNINWRAVPRTVRTITDSIPAFDVDTSTLYRMTEDNSPQLKLTWQGFPGETTATHLPLFDADGDRNIPMSEDDFPFEQPLHALFTMDMYHNTATNRRYLTANLIRLVAS